MHKKWVIFFFRCNDGSFSFGYQLRGIITSFLIAKNKIKKFNIKFQLDIKFVGLWLSIFFADPSIRSDFETQNQQYFRKISSLLLKIQYYITFSFSTLIFRLIITKSPPIIRKPSPLANSLIFCIYFTCSEKAVSLLSMYFPFEEIQSNLKGHEDHQMVFRITSYEATPKCLLSIFSQIKLETVKQKE